MNNKKDKISDQLTICGTKVLIDVPSNSKLYNPAYGASFKWAVRNYVNHRTVRNYVDHREVHKYVNHRAVRNYVNHRAAFHCSHNSNPLSIFT